jgi:hypothetical protein
MRKLMFWLRDNILNFRRWYAICMGCGHIHKHYRMVKGQLCYLLYCEGCESTRMHQPGEKIGTIQRLNELFDKSKGDCYS